MDGIRRILLKDEQVLWTGEPRRGFVLRPDDSFQIPFGVFWCGFVAFWLHNAIKTGKVSFIIFGGSMLGIGLYGFVVQRFIFDLYRRARTVYAVTNDRVIIVSKVLSEKVISLPYAKQFQVELRLRPSGEGTISFGPREVERRGRSNPVVDRPALEFIPDGQRVYNLIMDAQRRAIGSLTDSRDAITYREL